MMCASFIFTFFFINMRVFLYLNKYKSKNFVRINFKTEQKAAIITGIAAENEV